MRIAGPRTLGAVVVGGITILATTAAAQLPPDWDVSIDVDSSLQAGLGGMVVDPAGVTYVTGVAGSSQNNDIVTAAIRQDGELLWSSRFDGAQQGHDLAHGIALAPGGLVLVCGSTPDASFVSNVLVLVYDAATGELFDSVQHASGPATPESGRSVAADSQGNVYVGGSTIGDGGDGLLLKFDPNLDLLWSRTWDGAATAPTSQDVVLQVLLSPAEEPVALIHGVMATDHPDYVVVTYAPLDGAVIWEADWGSSGEDAPRDMVIDPGGDVLVTGNSIHGTNQYGTIRLRGSDGALLWAEYDTGSVRDTAVALALDDAGGVYVTGAADPDGDFSNLNDNFYTVRRDALTGSFSWSHRYGTNGVGHYDVPADVVVDHDGHVYVTGYTSSPPYAGDAITLMLDAGNGVELDRCVFAGGATEMVFPLVTALDAADRLLVGGRTYDGNTGAVAMLAYRIASQAGQDGHFVDLGYGLAGSFAPRLDGSGSLAASGSFKLSFTQLPPSAFGVLVVGVDLGWMPFKTGTLLPAPDLLLLVPNVTGSVDLDATMPSGIPSHASLYLHGWFADAGAPKRMCASNAMEMILP